MAGHGRRFSGRAQEGRAHWLSSRAMPGLRGSVPTSRGWQVHDVPLLYASLLPRASFSRTAQPRVHLPVSNGRTHGPSLQVTSNPVGFCPNSPSGEPALCVPVTLTPTNRAVSQQALLPETLPREQRDLLRVGSTGPEVRHLYLYQAMRVHPLPVKLIKK